MRPFQQKLLFSAPEWVPSGTRTLARIGNNQLNYQVGKGRISPDHGSCRRRILSVLSSASSHHERDGIQRGSQELRGPTLHDLTHFRSILSRPDRSIITVLTDEASQRQLSSDSRAEELVRYNQDWTGEYRGSSSLVLRPTNTSEVSSILRYCHENFIGVVPQGGNTGLCGGATPLHDEVIISLEGMNTIYGIDGQSGILTCDAGAILENLHSFANERGYLFPLDIGAKGSCQIGGNVSTNAGGQYFFRFGGLHGTVMGLEVVLPDGRVMHLNMENVDDYGTIQQSKRIASHRKDNTGYDLKHLFIGAEGTIGMITKVSIACPALPTSKNATLLVCDSYCNVLKVLKTAKEELGEILSAFELMDYNTLSFVFAHGFGGNDSGSRLLHDLIQSDCFKQEPERLRPLYLLVETQGSNSVDDASKMDTFLTRLFDSETIINGFLAQDERQLKEMWTIRESCNPCVAQAGCVYKFDVSIPIEDYMEVAWEVKRELSVSIKDVDLIACVWGHVNDGNAHINIVTPGRFKKESAIDKSIEAAVFDSVLKRSGSISAEHGLGQKKNEALGRIKGQNVLDVMAQIKGLFDPHGIMNPGKYLPKKN